ncbi:thiolase-like protein [Scenedesmus sp. NREL 46B-D3]|nr:thiolase-like protein [Scenedesmus sp. NREL 46B-D3]
MERLGSSLQLAGLTSDALEQETGIKERRMWPTGTTVVQAATWAAEKALDASGIPRNHVGVICSTSVYRDYLEPSMAVCVQQQLGLPSSCTNFDVTNACVGMMNGMLVVAGMIEAGVCEYGLVVCAESLQMYAVVNAM